MLEQSSRRSGSYENLVLQQDDSVSSKTTSEMFGVKMRYNYTRSRRIFRFSFRVFFRFAITVIVATFLMLKVLDCFTNVTNTLPDSDKLNSESYENPSVLTKFLYVPGHSIHPRHTCKNKGQNLRLLIAVTSSPSHYARRIAIRSTWGSSLSKFKDVQLSFAIGVSRNQEENEVIKQESMIYGDIIQVKFFHIKKLLA